MGTDMHYGVRRFIESLGPNFDTIIRGTWKEPGIGRPCSEGPRNPGDVVVNPPVFICRLPRPGKSDALFIYKGVLDNNLPHLMANEVAGTQYAARWQRNGRYEHVKIPEVYHYNYAHEPGVAVAMPHFVCLEYIEGHDYGQGPTCEGWTFREKRNFVRQMALFRLSVLLNEPPTEEQGHQISGPGGKIITRSLNNHWRPVEPGPDVAYCPTAEYYDNCKPAKDMTTWTQQTIANDIMFYSSLNPDYYARYYRHLCKLDMIGQARKTPYPPLFPAAPNDQAELVGILQAVRGTTESRRFRTLANELSGRYYFGHNDIEQGMNIRINNISKNIVAVIDWEFAMFLPYSESIADLHSPHLGLVDADEWDAFCVGKTAKDLPFETEGLGDHFMWTWEEYLDYMRERQRLRTFFTVQQRKAVENQFVGPIDPESTMPVNNFACYGTLTPEDLYYGETLDEDLEYDPQDDVEAEDNQEFLCNTHVEQPPEAEGSRGWVGAKFKSTFQSEMEGTWYYGPVMRLVHQYMEVYHGANTGHKFSDPMVHHFNWRGISPHHFLIPRSPDREEPMDQEA